MFQGKLFLFENKIHPSLLALTKFLDSLVNVRNKAIRAIRYRGDSLVCETEIK